MQHPTSSNVGAIPGLSSFKPLPGGTKKFAPLSTIPSNPKEASANNLFLNSGGQSNSRSSTGSGSHGLVGIGSKSVVTNVPEVGPQTAGT